MGANNKRKPCGHGLSQRSCLPCMRLRRAEKAMSDIIAGLRSSAPRKAARFKPCVHGKSPRRCTAECRKRYWREMAVNYRVRQVAYTKEWRLRNPGKAAGYEREKYRRVLGTQRLYVALSSLTPETPALLLLPNEV